CRVDELDKQEKSPESRYRGRATQTGCLNSAIQNHGAVAPASLDDDRLRNAAIPIGADKPRNLVPDALRHRHPVVTIPATSSGRESPTIEHYIRSRLG